jgi:hypothetical protein
MDGFCQQGNEPWIFLKVGIFLAEWFIIAVGWTFHILNVYVYFLLQQKYRMLKNIDSAKFKLI